MRFSLRTLLIAFLLVGPLSIWGWAQYRAWQQRRDEQRIQAEFDAKWLQVVSLSEQLQVPHSLNVGCSVGMTPQDWDRRLSSELKRLEQLSIRPTMAAAPVK